jgi:hypothetical protein
MDRDALKAVLRPVDEIERHKKSGPVGPRFVGQACDTSPSAEPSPTDARADRMDSAPPFRQVDTRRSRRFGELWRLYRQFGAARGAIAAVSIRQDRPQQRRFHVGVGLHPRARVRRGRGVTPIHGSIAFGIHREDHRLAARHGLPSRGQRRPYAPRGNPFNRRFGAGNSSRASRCASSCNSEMVMPFQPSASVCCGSRSRFQSYRVPSTSTVPVLLLVFAMAAAIAWLSREAMR